MKKRLCVLFSGRVQGVGFRFTADSIAQSLGITGWVRNLRSGEVEIAAEASQEILDGFLSQLNGQFREYIRESRVTWESATGEFEDFQIGL